MLRIDKARKPKAFHAKVEIPGEAWLKQNPASVNDDNMPSYWRDVFDEFYDAYHGICAFTLFRHPKSDGMEVDHFRPKSRFRNLAYKWSNFRLVIHRVNQKKWANLVADPFKIPKDAFYIDFMDGRIQLNRMCVMSPNVSASLIMTRDKLALNDEGLPESRKQACDDYLSHELGIRRLTRESPFVAYEMLRQGMLKVEDRDICRNILKSIGFSWITA